MRGRFGNVNINASYTAARGLPEVQRKFAESDERYYAGVDWALDIRDAQSLGLGIRGIPVHLIRRDSATQAIVLRKQISELKWKNIDLNDTWWNSTLSSAASKANCDVVLIAPKLDKSFAAQVEGIRRLREAGIAEPD